MRIRTRLRIGSLLIMLLYALFIVTVIYFLSAVRYANKKQEVTELLAERSFQSSLLSNEYVRNPGERAKAQWVSLYESRERLLQEYRPLFSEEPERSIFLELRLSILGSKPLFEQLVRSIESGSSDTIIQEINNQLNIGAQDRVTLVSRLSSESRDAAARAAQTLTFIVFVIGFLVLVISAGFYLMTMNISASVRKLGEGTKRIAEGNFAHRLSVSGNDEIADMAWLFNAMATELQTFRTTLERKVEERTADIQKFKQAVEASSEAVVILTSPEYTVSYANPAFSRITGYTVGDVLGQRMEYTSAAHNNRSISDQLREAMNEGRFFYSDELVVKRKDGSEYFAEITLYPVHTDDTEKNDRSEAPAFFVLIHRDISVRKNVDRAKSDFIALASHQLRTPLSEIRWALASLEREKLPDGQREVIVAAHTASIRMAETIKAMLTISHIETQKIMPEIVNVSLNPLLKEMFRSHQKHWKKKNISASIKCPSDLTLRTDMQLLKEVLSNLLSNAFKYTPENGTITVSAHDDGRYVQLTVQDSGYGIPQQDQARIFEKFFRASNIVDREEDGSGIGLYMVHLLMKILGGTVSFVSKENAGTTFTLSFPSAP